VKKEYARRKKVTITALQKIENVAVSNPMGAFYCIAKLPVDSAEDFSKFLLTDFEDQGQTVMLAPAAGFYSSPELGKDQVRLAFVLESKKLIRAAEILEKALESYNNS
jgi:aspartate aminotransferase